MKRELIYTILDLEEWNQEATCRFCRGLNKAVCQIRTRSKVTHSIIENDYACESCKEKFESNELPKCERCGRLKTKSNIDFSSGEYICDCIKDNEDLEEKELPALPQEERQSTFYERQINGLREELATTEEELQIEREEVVKFHEKSKEWSEKQKQELLNKIEELEAENKRLKGSTPQELLDEISKLKTRVKQLEEQNNQLVAQIETPPKNGSIKHFFKFGLK